MDRRSSLFKVSVQSCGAKQQAVLLVKNEWPRSLEKSGKGLGQFAIKTKSRAKASGGCAPPQMSKLPDLPAPGAYPCEPCGC